MQTKERLRREVADWIKRSQHEAKLAFAEGDLWSAVVWGAKVPELAAVERDMNKVGYETGMGVDVLYERVARITRELDPGGRIKTMVHRPHDITIGVDMAMGFGHAIATLFAIEMDRLGRKTSKLLDSAIIKGPLEEDLDRLGSQVPLMDEQLRARVHDRLQGRMGGKSADLIIIDDPLKE